MLQNTFISERSTSNPIKLTAIKFLAATPVGDTDRPMAIPLDLLNFVNQDHPVVVAYRLEHYPRQAIGHQEPMDPTPAIKPDRREEGERKRENIERLGGDCMGSGDPRIVKQGVSDEFKSLSGETADYHSFQELGGLEGDDRDEGAEVKKVIEMPRPKRYKTIVHRLSKTDMVRSLPFSLDVTEDEPSISSITRPSQPL